MFLSFIPYTYKLFNFVKSFAAAINSTFGIANFLQISLQISQIFKYHNFCKVQIIILFWSILRRKFDAFDFKLMRKFDETGDFIAFPLYLTNKKYFFWVAHLYQICSRLIAEFSVFSAIIVMNTEGCVSTFRYQPAVHNKGYRHSCHAGISN